MHVCTKDYVQIVIYTEFGPAATWYSFEVPQWDQVLRDAGIEADIVGMDTLDKLKQTFADARNLVEDMQDVTYSGLKVKLFCESV